MRQSGALGTEMMSVLSGIAFLVAGVAALFASVLAGMDWRLAGFLFLVFACVMCLPATLLALPIGGGFALWIGVREAHAAYLWSGGIALALGACALGWMLYVFLRERAGSTR